MLSSYIALCRRGILLLVLVSPSQPSASSNNEPLTREESVIALNSGNIVEKAWADQDLAISTTLFSAFLIAKPNETSETYLEALNAIHDNWTKDPDKVTKLSPNQIRYTQAVVSGLAELFGTGGLNNVKNALVTGGRDVINAAIAHYGESIDQNERREEQFRISGQGQKSGRMLERAAEIVVRRSMSNPEAWKAFMARNGTKLGPVSLTEDPAEFMRKNPGLGGRIGQALKDYFTANKAGLSEEDKAALLRTFQNEAGKLTDAVVPFIKEALQAQSKDLTIAEEAALAAKARSLASLKIQSLQSGTYLLSTAFSLAGSGDQAEVIAAVGYSTAGVLGAGLELGTHIAEHGTVGAVLGSLNITAAAVQGVLAVISVVKKKGKAQDGGIQALAGAIQRMHQDMLDHFLAVHKHLDQIYDLLEEGLRLALSDLDALKRRAGAIENEVLRTQDQLQWQQRALYEILEDLSKQEVEYAATYYLGYRYRSGQALSYEEFLKGESAFTTHALEARNTTLAGPESRSFHPLDVHRELQSMPHSKQGNYANQATKEILGLDPLYPGRLSNGDHLVAAGNFLARLDLENPDHVNRMTAQDHLDQTIGEIRRTQVSYAAITKSTLGDSVKRSLLFSSLFKYRRGQRKFLAEVVESSHKRFKAGHGSRLEGIDIYAAELPVSTTWRPSPTTMVRCDGSGPELTIPSGTWDAVAQDILLREKILGDGKLKACFEKAGWTDATRILKASTGTRGGTFCNMEDYGRLTVWVSVTMKGEKISTFKITNNTVTFLGRLNGGCVPSEYPKTIFPSQDPYGYFPALWAGMLSNSTRSSVEVSKETMDRVAAASKAEIPPVLAGFRKAFHETILKEAESSQELRDALSRLAGSRDLISLYTVLGLSEALERHDGFYLLSQDSIRGVMGSEGFLAAFSNDTVFNPLRFFMDQDDARLHRLGNLLDDLIADGEGVYVRDDFQATLDLLGMVKAKLPSPNPIPAYSLDTIAPPKWVTEAGTQAGRNVTFRFSALREAGVYQVRVKTLGREEAVREQWVNDTVASFQLDYETDYEASVRAINLTGFGKLAYLGVSTPLAPLAAPTFLEPSTVSPKDSSRRLLTSPRIVFSAVDKATAYTLQFRSKDGTFDIKDTLLKPEVTWPALPAPGAYTLCVTALRDARMESAKTCLEVDIPMAPPEAPKWSVAPWLRGDTLSVPKLAWEKSLRALEYKVLIASGDTVLFEAKLGALSLDIGSLPRARTYVAEVCAIGELATVCSESLEFFLAADVTTALRFQGRQMLLRGEIVPGIRVDGRIVKKMLKRQNP